MYRVIVEANNVTCPVGLLRNAHDLHVFNILTLRLGFAITVQSHIDQLLCFYAIPQFTISLM